MATTLEKGLYVEIPPADYDALTKFAKRKGISKKNLVLTAVNAYLDREGIVNDVWGYHHSRDFCSTIGRSLFETITRRHPKRITSGKGNERYGLRRTFVGKIAAGVFESRFGSDILSHNDIFRLARSMVADHREISAVIDLIKEAGAERDDHSNGGGECRINFTVDSNISRINLLRLIEAVRVAIGVSFNLARSIVFHRFLSDVMDEYHAHKSMLFPPSPDDDLTPIETKCCHPPQPPRPDNFDLFENHGVPEDEALKKAKEVVRILEARRIVNEQGYRQ